MSDRPTVRLARPDDRERLFDIWHSAVKATHHFLSDLQFDEIADAVRNQYLVHVVPEVILDDAGQPVAFMSMTENNLDALFVDASARGKGHGKALLDLAKSRFDEVLLEVNEQNPHAHEFYRRQGFVDVRRTPTDQEGRPFPLVYMRWSRSA